MIYYGCDMSLLYCNREERNLFLVFFDSVFFLENNPSDFI
ncbi:hypothetical protein DSUL_20303 [Desulfovibrionales bacterium]